ncbi:hypothetical protein GCM10010260_04340 [Streptomyces filipinensis]|uniref:Uncharacterized protein n=1 Tax=Streptomyces filipinensis TaxID=66887 RepID=A0A918I760_9ACTN|nr:hypothetical protein GCM10010260_04340 [Streptomyces filipinensis]
MALGIAASPALAQAGPPSDAGVQPIEVDDNPPVSCPTGATGFRVEDPTTGSVNIPGDGNFTITVTDTTAGQVFSFDIPTADHRSAIKVVAKGGTGGANVYTYDSTTGFPNGITMDGSLHAPINPSGKFADLSHIDFCVIPSNY